MPPPSLTLEVFDALPPAVQAYVRYLEGRLADLEARLGQNPANSSKPPSSDPPHVKPAPPKTPTGKRKGGQPGHPKRPRPDLPPDAVVELRADICDRCSLLLEGNDPAPIRHQVIEIPPVRPHVTEYRRHRLSCPRCGRVTGPALPAEARGGYGSRVGKRGVARLCGDLFGVPISPSAVCDLQRRTATALEPVVQEAHTHVAGKPANVDETGERFGLMRHLFNRDPAIPFPGRVEMCMGYVLPAEVRSAMGAFDRADYSVLKLDVRQAVAEVRSWVVSCDTLAWDLVGIDSG
jgi:transposase